jgi:hypothetical protein
VNLPRGPQSAWWVVADDSEGLEPISEAPHGCDQTPERKYQRPRELATRPSVGVDSEGWSQTTRRDSNPLAKPRTDVTKRLSENTKGPVNLPRGPQPAWWVVADDSEGLEPISEAPHGCDQTPERKYQRPRELATRPSVGVVGGRRRLGGTRTH